MRRDRDDPFDDIFREIERMMQDVMFGDGGIGVDADADDVPHVSVQEYDDRIAVVADLPGVDRDDIHLQCDGRVLSIAADGAANRFDERIRLPARVDERSASARYNNGVLEVRLDRIDDSADISVE